jgi:hypothetical protein
MPQGDANGSTSVSTGQMVPVSPGTVHYRWAMQNVPVLRSEPFMTTPRDYLARVDFELAGVSFPGRPFQELTTSWDKIQQDLLNDEHFGGQLRKGGFLKSDIAALKAKHSELLDRAAAVHALVRGRMKCTGQMGIASQHGVQKAWEEHKGSVPDINLLLIALLREAGLQANPVILSTRGHGRAEPTFPVVSNYDYVVAHVQLPDGQQVLADATQELAPFGMLPEQCLNGQGRLITGESAGRWVPLSSPYRFGHFRSAQLTLDERGNLTGTVHEEHQGYFGVEARGNLQRDGEKKYLEQILKDQADWKIDKFSFKDVAALDKPLAVDLQVRIPSQNDQPLNAMYLTPLQQLGDAANPFRQPERRFPVDLGARREETSVLTLHLPADFVVEELPKNALIELPDGGGRFTFSITPMGNSLQIMSRLQLNRPVYFTEEYASLRTFYEKALAKQAEKIVLKRKS